MVDNSLLKISTTNIKIEMRVQKAELRYDNASQPVANQKTNPGQFTVSQNKPAKLNIDTYNFRRSLGYAKTKDVISDAASKGKQSVSNYIQRQNTTGRALAQIQDGTQIQDVVGNRIRNDQKLNTMNIARSADVDITYEANVFESHYQGATISNDWQIDKPTMQYVPGGITIDVVQKPSVEIEYVGKPLYFPRAPFE